MTTACLKRLETVVLGHGEVVFAEGDPSDYLYFVVSGRIKVHSRERNGRDRLVALLGPADQFGEVSLLDPAPRMDSASAVGRTELARLSKPLLDQSMREHPEVAIEMMRVISRRLRRARGEIADLISLDVPGRVAQLLRNLARRFGRIRGGQLWVDHQLTQTELADLVGATRETLNKTLTQFVARGWIQRRRGSIVITDRAWLSRGAP